jgi:prepilin-type N-terminal cleavage/methylation domain-containing protein
MVRVVGRAKTVNYDQERNMDLSIRFFERDRQGRHGKSVKGFTLIELMVVVVIIGLISAFLVPMILGLRDKETPSETSVPKEVKTIVSEKEPDFEKKTATKTLSIAPITESAEVKVKLVARNYLHRLKVYTLFDATFRGRFIFRNPSDDLDQIRLEFPFPEGTTQARDVSLKFLDVSGKFIEPDGVTYDLKGMWWVGYLPKDKEIEAQVTYGAQGYDRFVYEGPGAGRAGAFKLTMALEGVTTEFIPAETLQPTTVGPGHLEWDYRNLVTDRKVIVELPGAMSPIGRIILLSELAGLAIFLFGLGFLYLSELKQPGRLDNFRWGDFLLLALNYFLFFIIFMVFSLGGEMGTWTAMGLSGVLSLPLLVVHAWRILDGAFALTRVLPLTVFTLAIVINGVYGGDYRKFIFIGFAVTVIALLTFTYKKWMEGRRTHCEAKKRKSEEQKSLEMEKNKNEKTESERVEKRRSMERKLKKPFEETATQLNRLEALAEEANMIIEYLLRKLQTN